MDKSIIRRHAVALIRQRPRIAGSVDSCTKLLVEFMKVIAAIPVSMSSAPSGQYPGANAVNVQPNQKNLELTHRERPEAQPDLSVILWARHIMRVKNHGYADEEEETNGGLAGSGPRAAA
ncbi:hypothetical protein WL37_11525 [Burkholderia ubonensis]|nr:hypothetical protein WL37_11525 [Burkholderia ubonensis]